MFYRQDLVNSICDDFLSSSTKSLYCKGPFGCGKSTLLRLIGREITSRGYKVFFLYAKEVEENWSKILEVLQKESTNGKCVLLVDEASLADYSASIWTKLFKSPGDNGVEELRILGMGVPSIIRVSSLYSHSQSISYLLLDKDSKDMEEIVEFWVNFVQSRNPLLEPLKVSKQSVIDICHWICDYTNGHMYLLLSFCLDFFSSHKLEEIVDKYETIFTSKEFFLRMHNIRKRCGLSASDLPTSDYIEYLFPSNINLFAKSVNALSRLGYLDDRTYKFVSDYVLCCFQNASAESIPVCHNKWPSDYNLADKRIIGGLRHMQISNFYDHIGNPNDSLKPSVEDAISQRWSLNVIKEFSNVFVSPQNRTLSRKGRVDFIFNGREKIAIEVALNGTQSVYKTKLDKFLSKDGVYREWKDSFAIFNIVTASRQRKVLNDIPIESLQYIYEFNVETNVLYRGDKSEPFLKCVSQYLRTPPSPTEMLDDDIAEV